MDKSIKQKLANIFYKALLNLNDAHLRRLLTLEVTDLLEQYKKDNKIFDYNIVINERNNPPTIIDDNKLVGEVMINQSYTQEYLNIMVGHTGVLINGEKFYNDKSYD